MSNNSLINKNQFFLNKQLVKNNKFFTRLELMIAEELDFDRCIKLSEFACSFASSNHTGRFVSSIIEKKLSDLSKASIIDLSAIKFKKNSFLHVMTKGYETGGHTRAVEQWINSSSQSSCHSIFFSNQGIDEVPSKLKKQVELKNGKIYNSKFESPLKNSLHLREIAAGYEYVILHVHMFDVLPIIAFGTSAFNRPVLFFNHADHQFWIGASISDYVLDISSGGQKITKNFRGIEESFILPVPIKINQNIINKKEARTKLGFNLTSKILVTVGSAYKFNPIGSMSFIDFANDLIASSTELIIVVIGPSLESPMWRRFCMLHPGRVIVTGNVNEETLTNYIASSDCYVDSFPCGSGTAVLDAISLGASVYTIDNGFAQFDSYEELQVDFELLSTLILEKVRSGSIRKDLECKVRDDVVKLHSSEWSLHLRKILSIVRDKKHTVRYLVETKDQLYPYDLRLIQLHGLVTLKECFNSYLKLTITDKIRVAIATLTFKSINIYLGAIFQLGILIYLKVKERLFLLHKKRNLFC